MKDTDENEITIDAFLLNHDYDEQPIEPVVENEDENDGYGMFGRPD